MGPPDVSRRNRCARSRRPAISNQISWRAAMRLACASTITLVMSNAAKAYTLAEVGEWVVSCDNTGTCAAVNASQRAQLRVARPSPFGMSRLCIHRRGGLADVPELHITILGRTPPKRSISSEEPTLRVVSTSPGQTDFPLENTGPSHWKVPDLHVGAMLRALADDVQLHLVPVGRGLPERLSVDGIGEALAMIDRARQRSGTSTALRQSGDDPGVDGQEGSSPPTLVTAPLPRLPSGVLPSAHALQINRRSCLPKTPQTAVGYRLLGDTSTRTASCGSRGVAPIPVRSRIPTRSRRQAERPHRFISPEHRRSARPADPASSPIRASARRRGSSASAGSQRFRWLAAPAPSRGSGDGTGRPSNWLKSVAA